VKVWFGGNANSIVLCAATKPYLRHEFQTQQTDTQTRAVPSFTKPGSGQTRLRTVGKSHRGGMYMRTRAGG
jgi:hypothetical protein